VRASKHSGRLWVKTLEFPKNVADAVNVDLQANLPHLMNEELTAAQFFDRKDQPSHRAVIA
jgi:hypothetical protein